MPSRDALETLGKGIALVALLFSIATYFFNQHREHAQERYEATLRMTERYVEDGVLEKETGLSVRLLHYTSQIDLNDHESVPDDLFEPIARLIVFNELEGDQVPGSEPELFNLMAILDYYGRVEFCISSGVCESEVASVYFCPRVIEFTTANERLIAFLNEYLKSERRFTDVEKLVAHCRS